MSLLKESVYDLSVVFNSQVLGSQPGNDSIALDYLIKKILEENPHLTPQQVQEEIDSLPDEVKKGTTCFHRDADGNPLLYTYVVKGALKDSASTLNGLATGKMVTKKKKKGDDSDGDDVVEVGEKVTAFLANVTRTVNVNPRRIPLITDKPIGFLERGVRVIGKDGPRVFLLRSEMIEEGAHFDCQIQCLETPRFTLTEELLRTLLDYSSRYMGIGQWRNSGMYGRYDYTLTKVV